MLMPVADSQVTSALLDLRAQSQVKISRGLKTLPRKKAVQATHRVQGEQSENSQICPKLPQVCLCSVSAQEKTYLDSQKLACIWTSSKNSVWTRLKRVSQQPA